jgi:DNA-binding NtrC family response regulator
MAKILIVDDERSIRETVCEVLSYEGYDVDTAPDGMEGLKMFEENEYEVVLCDVKMPTIDGMEVLDKMLSLKPYIPVVMITGHGNVETAVNAMKKGAFDFIEKPLDLNILFLTIQDAIDISKEESKGVYTTIRGMNEREVESTIMRSTMNEIEFQYEEEGEKRSVRLPARVWNLIVKKFGAGKKTKD